VSADRAARDERSDGELVTALRAGDAVAFDELYRRHRDWVLRLAHRVTGSGTDALDVLQETFLYLLRKAPELELRVRMTTLLFPVVRNLSLQRRRQRGTASAAVEPLAEDPPLASAEELVAALGGLPEAQRQALLLRFVDGKSLQEIAAAQGVPLGTVKSRLHQALATLRSDPAARRYFLA
jgi:RNA polymerase sigma-70 factor (ECF subfamily)